MVKAAVKAATVVVVVAVDGVVKVVRAVRAVRIALALPARVHRIDRVRVPSRRLSKRRHRIWTATTAHARVRASDAEENAARGPRVAI
jgi:hypothetical protein